MGQKVNPNIFRLGKTKEWNSKYSEKKSIEQSLYTFKDIEIQSFIDKFFKDNDLILNNCKLNYSNNTLHIFISYYLTFESNVLTNKILIQKPSKKYRRIIKYILLFFNYRQLKNNKIIKSKKLYKIRKIKFLKYSNTYTEKGYKNIKNFKMDSFVEKLIESLNQFLNKKETKIVLTFKQLNKNIKVSFNKKRLGLIKEKLAELRLFEKNPFFNEGINVFFTFIKNNESPELATEFIANQLKQLKKNHNFFLKFIKAALTLLNNKIFNSNVDGIKIKIKGKFNKSPRAKHKTITIGNLPLLTMTSNTHYSEKISYSSNGTFGVKIWTYKNL